MRHCPNCNAELGGSGFLCAECGWGTQDHREGVEIQPGLKITAGASDASTKPVALARDGAYDFGEGDPGQVPEARPERNRGPTSRDHRLLQEPYTIVIQRTDDGRVTVNVKHTIVYHSPDGFEYGYGGSGPADLALNILAAFIPKAEAYRLHQEFKCQFIAPLCQDVKQHVIAGTVIRQWLEAVWQ